MSIFKTSGFLKLAEKLDIQENSISQACDGSFFANKFNGLVDFIQDKTASFAQTSFIAKNIDKLILLLVSLIIVSTPVASTGIVGLITLAAFCLLLFKFIFVKGEKYTLTSIDIPVFLYIIIAGLSVTFSSLLLPSLKGYIKMIIYFGGYLTFASILKNHPKRVLYLLGLLAVTVSMESLYAVCQQITGIEALASWQDTSSANPEQLMGRVYGSLKPFNPNLLAGYLVGGFSSVLGMAFLSLYKKKYRLSLLAFAGVAITLLAIVFTGSRGSYIALAGMSVVFVLLSGHLIWHDFSDIKWLKKAWIWAIIIGIIGIVAVILLSPALQHRILSIFASRDDSSNSFRFNVYHSTFRMFLDNWLTGIGTGNKTFRLMYGLYMITGFDALGAYCVPLEVATESGIFGLFAFLWMISLSYIRGIKHIIRDNLFENKIIISACLIGITGLMLHGLVDTIWYRPQVNLTFWLLVAILSIITFKSSKCHCEE